MADVPVWKATQMRVTAALKACLETANARDAERHMQTAQGLIARALREDDQPKPKRKRGKG